MKTLLSLALLLASTSAFAETCGPNCYLLNINGDNQKDKVEFVIGMQSDANQIHALNLKVSLTSEKTVRIAHDRVTKTVLEPFYSVVTDTADITKNFELYVASESKIATVKWFESDGSKQTSYYQINADGSVKIIK